MKEIRIGFSGMAGEFNPNDNFIVNRLKEKYKVIISKKPDYLFFSQNSTDYLKHNCVRIFYTAENLVPDFNICDYGISFQDINFEDRYIRFPLYLVEDFKAYEGDNYATDLQLAKHKHENASLDDKSSFCSFVYSNSLAVPCREKFFDSLSKYKKVSSGGGYRNNVGGPVESKLDFQKKHKFVIAFENTSNPGYTTEKIVHAFAACAIPIYWGNPNIVNEFNSKSFINCHDFGLSDNGEQEAIDKIVKEVERLDNDDEAYLAMLKEPALRDRNYVDRKNKEFDEFLFHIFDQPLNKAYRRNRYYWGERYERKQRIGNSFYQLCRKFIPIRDIIKKPFNHKTKR